MKKGILASIIAGALLVGCGGAPEQPKQIASVNHPATGIIAPGQIGKLSRSVMTDFNKLTQSSSVSYSDDLSTVTTYFYKGDQNLQDYFETSKLIMVDQYSLDRALVDGASEVVVNGTPLSGQTIRAYDLEKVRGKPELAFAELHSISVYEYEDYLIKVRNTTTALIGGDMTAKTLEMNAETEQALLQALLTNGIPQ